MPNLLDLCSNPESRETILGIQRTLQAEKRKEEEIERKRMETRHREKHIFESYEQALDWLMQNPDGVISWHVKTLSWNPDENRFLSYEQEYSLDGVVPYDVKRFYTRDELLDQVYTYLKESCMTLDDLKDKYGKLDYVHIIRK